MMCPHGQVGRGLSRCGHFANKEGGGQFFAILCGRLLRTAPNAVFRCRNVATPKKLDGNTNFLQKHCKYLQMSLHVRAFLQKFL